MKRLLKLAWRNVGRNRRRSLITMSAVIFTLVIITLANSVQYGTYDLMEGQAVRMFTGEVQIQRKGYRDEQTMAYSLTEDETDWDSLFASMSWPAERSRRLTGFGLVSSDSSSVGAAIIGIEPKTEAKLANFSQRVIAGDPLAAGDEGEILVGKTLAENLHVGLGDTLVVLTQGYHNEMGAEVYRIKGLLFTGTGEIDRAMMIMTMADAQMLFAMDGRFTEWVIRSDDFRSAGRHAQDLRKATDGLDVDVLTWEELMPELQQTRAFDDAGNNIFYLFLILLVGFEIFNTATMTVLERVREFGILQSIGLRPNQVSLLVFLELAIKIVIGIGVGMAILIGFALAFPNFTIPLSESLREMYNSFGFTIEGYGFSTRTVVFIQPLISVLVVSLLAIIYPVWKVKQYSPVEAMRHV